MSFSEQIFYRKQSLGAPEGRLKGRLYLRAELNVVFVYWASKIRTQLETFEFFLINATNADLLKPS